MSANPDEDKSSEELLEEALEGIQLIAAAQSRIVTLMLKARRKNDSDSGKKPRSAEHRDYLAEKGIQLRTIDCLSLGKPLRRPKG